VVVVGAQSGVYVVEDAVFTIALVALGSAWVIWFWVKPPRAPRPGELASRISIDLRGEQRCFCGHHD
jgi:hypothetical protein